jgi:uncharacterized membrane protein YkoI
MSKNDIKNTQNGIKNTISKHIVVGIFVGIISAIGIVGISNISAQEAGMTTTTAAAGTTNATDATSQMGQTGNLTGSIEVDKTIAEAFKSKVTVSMIDAITAAQNSVGPNSIVKEAELTHAYGYLVYKMKVVDENMKKYKVIVDPGNGSILMQKELKYGEYGHDKMDKDKEYKYKDGYKHDYDKMGYDKKEGYDEMR